MGNAGADDPGADAAGFVGQSLVEIACGGVEVAPAEVGLAPVDEQGGTLEANNAHALGPNVEGLVESVLEHHSSAKSDPGPDSVLVHIDGFAEDDLGLCPASRPEQHLTGVGSNSGFVGKDAMEFLERGGHVAGRSREKESLGVSRKCAGMRWGAHSVQRPIVDAGESVASVAAKGV